jgi:MraZ protein
MDKKGLRGSASARIDDKGRLKIPTQFRGLVRDQTGAEVFVTSLTGECVRIYPMTEWLAVEQKVLEMPSNLPARLKFLDRVNYYGLEGELDGQGRVVISPLLREHAAIVGDGSVIGRINHLEVWNVERFNAKLVREPWGDRDGLKLSKHGV